MSNPAHLAALDQDRARVEVTVRRLADSLRKGLLRYDSTALLAWMVTEMSVIDRDRLAVLASTAILMYAQATPEETPESG